MKKIILTLLLNLLYLFVSSQNFQWAKQIGGPGIDISMDIKTDDSGNVYTVGYFTDSVDFDPGTGIFILSAPVIPGYTTFISKLDGSGNFVWAKQLSGTNMSFAYTLNLDNAGNVYVGGYFQGTTDFDPGSSVYNLTSIVNGGIFSMKLSSNGDFIWAKNFGGGGYDLCWASKLDNSKNVYLTGIFSGEVDFDPGPAQSLLYGPGAYILKLDSLGSFLWARSFDGTSPNSVTTDLSGNVFLTGTFRNTVDFDPGLGINNLTTTQYNDEAFIVKLNKDGNFVWAKQITGSLGPSDLDQGVSLITDSVNNVYVLGNFVGTTDFNPGASTNFLTSAGGYDMFLLKLDSLGNFVWVKSSGGLADDAASKLAIDSSGNIYMIGEYSGTVDFNPGPGINNLESVGMMDIVVAKFDPSGNYLWAGSMGGINDDLGYSITLDKLGNIYSTGYFEGAADYNPGTGQYILNSFGVYDIFITKLSQCSPSSIGLISGVSSICTGASSTYSITAVPSATGYTWTVPLGCNINYGQNTNIINVTFNAGSSGNITVVPFNSCGIGPSALKAVTVKLLPTVGATASPSSEVCPGSTITLIGTNALTYTWTGGVTNGVSFVPTSANTYTVTGTSANGCTKTSIISVTIKPVPTINSVSNQTFCNGQITQAVQLNGTPSNVLFDITGGASKGLANQVAVSSIPSFTVTTVGSAVVTITPKANGCVGPVSTYTMTVANCPAVTMNLKFYIQGYYLGSGLMQQVLFNQGETVDSNSIQTDYVIVELHSSLPPYAMVKTTIATLKTNGTLTCTFPGSVTNSPSYIVVHHRNGLETWSANPINIIPNLTYDFSNSASKTYGSNQVDVSGNGTIWAFYNGDLNQDENVDLLDLSLLEVDINDFLFGYYGSDINGDGNVDLLDAPLVELNINNFVFSEHP